MGISNKKRIIISVIITGLIFSVVLTSILIGIRFRPIRVIEIYDDKDFSRKYFFPGKGTKDNPYIISGYELSGNTYHNIRIYGTTKYFIIQNCTLRSSNKGIDLVNLHYGSAKVINNNFIDNDFGIIATGCLNCNISSNSFVNNHRGIEAKDGSYIINANNFFNCTQDGMYLSDNNFVDIDNNNFNLCGDGLFCCFAESVDITNNNVINCCSTGFYIDYISNLNVCNNTIANCSSGIGIDDCTNGLVCGNNITNASWSGMTISNSINVIIKDNNCSKIGLYGICLFSTTQSFCINNTCDFSNYNGIYVLFCSFNTINNNTCKNNKIGIRFFGSTSISVWYNTLEHNIDYGISTQGTNLTIFNNNFIDNNYDNNPEINSQAIDEGNYTNNINYIGFPVWYSETLQRGNFWSDLVWFAGAIYIIDPGNQTDIYPLEFSV